MGAGTFTKRERQHAAPVFIDRLDQGGIARTISPIHVQSETQHDEAWLQRLIFNFPQALPVHEIEPGFSRLVPVCLELPTPAGSVDNLYVTDRGDLVIAECKLWRNPEARREVVAQIIDYAHSMNGWTYTDLEGAVKRALIPETRPAAGLYDLVKPATEIDEADFVDAITRNLRLGRMLLLIVGDGIREGVETLSDFLQMHAGFHFTLGIVEMPVYGLPNGGFVVQPRVLARTINIERSVVSIMDGRPHLSPSLATTESPSARRRTSISQERLLEVLEEIEPGLPAALQSFIDRGADMGVTLEAAPKSLQIRWRGLDDVTLTLGGIDEHAELLTYNVCWAADGIGRVDLGHAYLERLAVLVGGDVRQTPSPAQWYVVVHGTKRQPPAMALLGHPDKWLAAIESYIEQVRRALAQTGT